MRLPLYAGSISSLHEGPAQGRGFLRLMAGVWQRLDAPSGLQAAKQHCLLRRSFLPLVAGVWQQLEAHPCLQAAKQKQFHAKQAELLCYDCLSQACRSCTSCMAMPAAKKHFNQKPARNVLKGAGRTVEVTTQKQCQLCPGSQDACLPASPARSGCSTLWGQCGFQEKRGSPMLVFAGALQVRCRWTSRMASCRGGSSTISSRQPRSSPDAPLIIMRAGDREVGTAAAGTTQGVPQLVAVRPFPKGLMRAGCVQESQSQPAHISSSLEQAATATARTVKGLNWCM